MHYGLRTKAVSSSLGFQDVLSLVLRFSCRELNFGEVMAFLRFCKKRKRMWLCLRARMDGWQDMASGVTVQSTK